MTSVVLRAWCRISLGIGNEAADIDHLVDAVRRIAHGDFAGHHSCDRHGDYVPTDLRVAV